MKCKNCKALIPDDSETCPECGVYVEELKIDDDGTSIMNAGNNDITEEMSEFQAFGFFLIVDEGIKFNLPSGKEVYIGRKDIGTTPDIDIGPFDKGPYISRNQGFFFVEENNLYFTDTSKNGTLLNNKNMEKNVRTKLKKGDELLFGKVKGVIGQI